VNRVFACKDVIDDTNAGFPFQRNLVKRQAATYLVCIFHHLI